MKAGQRSQPLTSSCPLMTWWHKKNTKETPTPGCCFGCLGYLYDDLFLWSYKLCFHLLGGLCCWVVTSPTSQSHRPSVTFFGVFFLKWVGQRNQQQIALNCSIHQENHSERWRFFTEFCLVIWCCPTFSCGSGPLPGWGAEGLHQFYELGVLESIIVFFAVLCMGI